MEIFLLQQPEASLWTRGIWSSIALLQKKNIFYWYRYHSWIKLYWRSLSSGFYIFFLYFISLNSCPANSKQVYSTQLNSTLTCAKCSEVDVLIVTPGKKKGRRDASQKKSQTLRVWGHGVVQARFMTLDLSWSLHLRTRVLDIVLQSNPDLLELFTWEKSGEESDGQLPSKMRVSPPKRGACPWRSMDLEIMTRQVKAGL